MDLKARLFLQQLILFHVTDCLHYYQTPAVDDQFSNFEITTAIPSDGTGGSQPMQEALKIEFNDYKRRYITFNFKGKGNAQLMFYSKNRAKEFKVELGGGASHNEVNIYSHRGKLFNTTLNGITSEHEYRSFWIRWQWIEARSRYRLHVGLCSDPRINNILSSTRLRYFKVKIYHIQLSTSSGSSGEWQFAAAGDKLGGCGDAISCSDGALECDQSDIDLQKDTTGLTGTCVPTTTDFSTELFGDGMCQTVCGTSNDICSSNDTCEGNTCVSPVTEEPDVTDEPNVTESNQCEASLPTDFTAGTFCQTALPGGVVSLELAGAVLIGTACGLALVVAIAYFVLKQAACNIKRIKSLFRSRVTRPTVSKRPSLYKQPTLVRRMESITSTNV